MTLGRLHGFRLIRSGFTLFELVVFIILLLILAGLFFERVLYYQEVIEDASMRQTVSMINTGINLKLADCIAKGQYGEIPQLGSRNPMDWLVAKPNNYFGELFDPAPGDVPRGNWYYDLRDHNLVYLVDHAAHYQGSSRKWIRFRVDLNYNTDRRSGFISARLVPASAYTWFAH